MIDPKLLRERPELARQGVRDRGGRYLPFLEEYLSVEQEHRALLREVEGQRARRNDLSQTIGKAKAAKDEEGARRLMAEVSALKAALSEKEAALSVSDAKMRELGLSLPNLPEASVPVGRSEADNRPLRSSGEPPRPGFKPLDHAALGEKLGVLEFAAAAKLSGSRFSLLKGAGARLHRALAQFMLDFHVREHGYLEINVPLLVRPEILEGTGQLPKFEQDLYKTGQSEETRGGPGRSSALFLIPTAEVPLTNLARGEILPAESLPRRFAAWTPCFRQEAGSYGKDVHGLIRQHQFEKVELVWLTAPEDSAAALEALTGHAEAVLKALELPCRVVELCTADIGFAAAKTFDLEVWMPGEGRYREISSCSNCGDFQARRMNARFRADAKSPPRFLHTLNGSGVAVGRAFAALLENHQRADGSVGIPAALRPYFGADEIRP